MKNKSILLITILFCSIIVLLAVSKNHSSNQPSLLMENQEEAEMCLENLLACDSQHAESIKNTFYKSVNQNISSIEEIPSDLKGKLIKVITENGNEYYLKISKTAILREIRKDSPKGEIVYQVVY